jgi:hypothetical protein
MPSCVGLDAVGVHVHECARLRIVHPGWDDDVIEVGFEMTGD